MQGVYVGSRPIKVGPATPKAKQDDSFAGHHHHGHQGVGASAGYGYGAAAGFGAAPSARGGMMDPSNPNYNPQVDPYNTTLFIGNLDEAVTEHLLWQSFARFGNLDSVRVTPQKRCGFVHFNDRNSAETALN